jgi:hypothetical protein
MPTGNKDYKKACRENLYLLQELKPTQTFATNLAGRVETTQDE